MKVSRMAKNIKTVKNYFRNADKMCSKGNSEIKMSMGTELHWDLKKAERWKVNYKVYIV